MRNSIINLITCNVVMILLSIGTIQGAAVPVDTRIGVTIKEDVRIGVHVKNDSEYPVEASIVGSHDTLARIAPHSSHILYATSSPINLKLKWSEARYLGIGDGVWDLTTLFNTKYHDNRLKNDENMVVTITTGGVWHPGKTFIEVARENKTAARMELGAITNVWDCFPGVKEEYLKPSMVARAYTVQELTTIWNDRSEKNKGERERIARLVLNLGHSYTKKEVEQNVEDFEARYNPYAPHLDERVKSLILDAFQIVDQAQKIIKASETYRNLKR